MSITNYLQQILEAHYGSEVRQSIHDAIETTYDDATASGNANAEVTLARGTYNNLNSRLNAMTSATSSNASDISSSESDIASLDSRVDALEAVKASTNTIFCTYTEAVNWVACYYTQNISVGAIVLFCVHDRELGVYHNLVANYAIDVTFTQYFTPTKYMSVEFKSNSYCNVRLYGFPGGAAVYKIIKLLN